VSNVCSKETANQREVRLAKEWFAQMGTKPTRGKDKMMTGDRPVTITDIISPPSMLGLAMETGGIRHVELEETMSEEELAIDEIYGEREVPQELVFG